MAKVEGSSPFIRFEGWIDEWCSTGACTFADGRPYLNEHCG
jgi:hypothetical protein